MTNEPPRDANTSQDAWHRAMERMAAVLTDYETDLKAARASAKASAAHNEHTQAMAGDGQAPRTGFDGLDTADLLVLAKVLAEEHTIRTEASGVRERVAAALASRTTADIDAAREELLDRIHARFPGVLDGGTR